MGRKASGIQRFIKLLDALCVIFNVFQQSYGNYHIGFAGDRVFYRLHQEFVIDIMTCLSFFNIQPNILIKFIAFQNGSINAPGLNDAFEGARLNFRSYNFCNSGPYCWLEVKKFGRRPSSLLQTCRLNCAKARMDLRNFYLQ